MGIALLIVFRRGPGAAARDERGPLPPPPQPLLPLPVKTLAMLRAEAALKGGGGEAGEGAPPPSPTTTTRRPDSASSTAAHHRAAALAAAPDGDDALECPVCFDRPADLASVVVFGCGHATCAACYTALLGAPTTPVACPLCRAPLKTVAPEGGGGGGAATSTDADVEAGGPTRPQRERGRWGRRTGGRSAPRQPPDSAPAASAGMMAGVLAASTVA